METLVICKIKKSIKVFYTICDDSIQVRVATSWSKHSFPIFGILIPKSWRRASLITRQA